MKLNEIKIWKFNILDIVIISFLVILIAIFTVSKINFENEGVLSVISLRICLVYKKVTYKLTYNLLIWSKSFIFTF